MTSYLPRRLGRAFLTLWFIVTVVFVATRLTGDPTDWLLADSATEEMRAMLRGQLGLDRPVHEQYLIYLRGVVGGDFGNSFYERRPVTTVFAERLPYTLQLMGLALLFAVLSGVVVGVVSAVQRNGWLDRLLMTGTFAAYATPDFVLGIGLILVFSLQLGWLPSSGRNSWMHLIMPVLTLGSSSAALIARLTRSSLLDVLGQDYVRTAKAKGVSGRAVVLRHALRPAFIPVLTMIGLMLGSLVGGAVVVETVFAWPGAGRLIVNAVTARDYPVLQFSILIVASVVVVVSVLIDLGYALLDPRVRITG